MIRFYGSHICQSCEEAISYLEKHQIPYDMTDITESTANLKEFLALRDGSCTFLDVKKEGRIGIPCFVRPDGILTLSLEEILRESGYEYQGEEA